MVYFRKMFIKVSISFLLLTTLLIGAFEKMEAGAGPLAMGKACVAMQDLTYAIFYNPANIPDSKVQFSLDYQNFYGIKGLSQANLVVNYPIRKLPVAFGVSSFGNNLYREMQINAAGAYRIGSKFSVGLSLQYYFCTIKDYGSQAAWGFNLGLAYTLIENVRIGSQVTNLNQPTISQIHEKLPQTFSFGINYQVNKLLMLNMDLFHDNRFDQEYRFGLDYCLSPHFNIRAGIIDRLNNYSGGCAIFLKTVVFEYALAFHQILGASHITSLIIRL
jgi:hypothetical protein